MRILLGIPSLFLLLFLAGAVIGNVFPTLYAIPLSICAALFLSYFGMTYIAYGPKQVAIDLIYSLWPIMPYTIRAWAIFNDRNI